MKMIIQLGQGLRHRFRIIAGKLRFKVQKGLEHVAGACTGIAPVEVTVSKDLGAVSSHRKVHGSSDLDGKGGFIPAVDHLRPIG